MTSLYDSQPAIPAPPACGLGEPARLQADASPWRVQALTPDDGDDLDRLFAACSRETVYLRFFGLVDQIPRAYAAELLAGEPETHDAVIARSVEGCQPIGLASVGRTTDVNGAAAELSMLVVDDWQARGVGAAMLDVVIARATARGVTTVRATVLPGREALLGTIGRRLPLLAWSRSHDQAQAEYRMPRIVGGEGPIGF